MKWDQPGRLFLLNLQSALPIQGNDCSGRCKHEKNEEDQMHACEESGSYGNSDRRSPEKKGKHDHHDAHRDHHPRIPHYSEQG